MSAGPHRASARGPDAHTHTQWGLAAFLVLLLGAVLAVALILARGAGKSEEPYSVRSAGPAGLLGLRLWLEELGYRVEVGRAPELAGDASLIFLFPDAELTAGEARTLSKRVEEGKTLVVAGADSVDLSRTLGVVVQRGQPIRRQQLRLAQPILPTDASRTSASVSGHGLSAMPGSTLTRVLVTTTGDQAAVLLERRKLGVVWHVGIDAAFTNEDLRTGWGRSLTLAALRGLPKGATVYIDNGEVQGRDAAAAAATSNEIDGLGQWLVRQPLGWAVLLAVALLLVYLFAQGRRLGPAIVVADPHRRRAAVENIQAMASLAQRAGHAEGVARYQKARLKRRLGQPWRVSAHLEDAAFVAALSEQARLAAEQAAALAELLAQFERVRDEGRVVQLVDAATRFTVE